MKKLMKKITVKKPLKEKPAPKVEPAKLPLPEPKRGVEPQILRGFKDILPSEFHLWKHLDTVVYSFARAHGFERIETPVLEPASLFLRTVGRQTDIVEKEMYTFLDKGNENVTLRPEATAPIARAYMNHGMLNLPQPVKLWYLMPMFRYDRPQAGRFREHHQFGFETLGEAHPIVDAELVSIAYRLLSELGLDITVQINSLGTADGRAHFINELVAHYRSRRAELCEDCKRRLTKNPLRVLDCKMEGCQPVKTSAPQLVDFIDEDSKNHFMRVLEYLDEAGVKYMLNPHLVRGLDYYNRTVFEFYAAGDDEGAQSSLGGGGRYDTLVETVGGRPTPGCGFAIGIERVIARLRARGLDTQFVEHPDVFVAQLGEAARKKIFVLIDELRRAGMHATSNLVKDGLKQQLEFSNRISARFTVILGQKEVLDGTIIIRDMDSGIQEIVDFKKVVAELKRKIATAPPLRPSAPPPVHKEDISVPAEEEEEDMGTKSPDEEKPAQEEDVEKEVEKVEK